MLDVRRLRLLRELHTRGTVTAVAEALAYSPSAVSQQLATLEREAGVPLMERYGRGLRLTDAGRGLVEHAEVVIARLELAEAELAESTGDEVAGRVRVAAFQTAASGLVLPLLGTLPRAAPPAAAGAGGDGGRGGAAAAPARRGRHRHRGGVRLRAPLARPSLSFRDVCRDPLVVVLPAHHPAARATRRRSRSQRSPTSSGLDPRRHRLPRRVRARVPRAGRVRPGRPPPLQRHGRARAARRRRRGRRADAVAQAARPCARRVRAARRGGALDRRIFLAARRGSTGRAALKVVSRALRDQARRWGCRAA